MNKKLLYLKKPLINPKLDYLIFFVTSKCNSKCKNCFYIDKLNKKDDLKLDEIKKISENMPNFSMLLLSGGEPFLRRDLYEIIKTFKENNKIKIIGIPTNGLTEEIYYMVLNILSLDIDTSINFSLDGLEKTYKKIRGVDGFKQVCGSINQLKPLRKIYPNLKINIHTVISDENYKEIDSLMEFVKKLEPDMHTFELVRGKEIKAPYDTSKFLKIQKEYLKKRGFFEAKYLFNQYKKLYDIQKNNKKWSFRCLAGKSIAVLDTNGDVRGCEILDKKLGNLRENNYDFEEILNNDKADKFREEIRDCSCTHCVFFNESLAHSFLETYMKIPFGR